MPNDESDCSSNQITSVRKSLPIMIQLPPIQLEKQIMIKTKGTMQEQDLQFF